MNWETYDLTTEIPMIMIPLPACLTPLLFRFRPRTITIQKDNNKQRTLLKRMPDFDLKETALI